MLVFFKYVTAVFRRAEDDLYGIVKTGGVVVGLKITVLKIVSV